MKSLTWAALAAFLIDQLSKYWIIHQMKLSSLNPIDVWSPFLNLRYGENRGINFGLGDGVSPYALIGLAVVICLAVVIWTYRTKQPRLVMISAGLLVGGALANVFDRCVYGYVVDMLNMSCCGINNKFVFNLADVFIFAGALGLVFFAKEPNRRDGKVKKGQ